MAIKGDQLTKFVTAQWYNEVTASVRHKSFGSSFVNSPNNHYVTLQNNTGSDFDRWTGVRVGMPLLDYEDPERLAHNHFVFELETVSASEHHNIAVLQHSVPSGASVRALLSGMTWLRLPDEPTERFIWVNDSNTLESHRIGRIEVLKYYAMRGETPVQINALSLGPPNNFAGLNFGPAQAFETTSYMALCLIGHLVSHPIEYAFELLTPFVSQIALANIYEIDGRDVHLYEEAKIIYDNQNIFGELDTGDTGLCFWQDETYYAYQAPCPI